VNSKIGESQVSVEDDNTVGVLAGVEGLLLKKGLSEVSATPDIPGSRRESSPLTGRIKGKKPKKSSRKGGKSSNRRGSPEGEGGEGSSSNG